MSASSSPYFFVSYSREDKNLQQRVVRELRERAVNVWVDIENLIPGTPAWEREVERSIRGAAGVIVLLSPNSNNSEWVRREISFAEGNRKRIFPILIRGDEDDSIPLRLSSHQRVDLRYNFESGLDHLANTLRNFLGETLVPKSRRKQKNSIQIDFGNFARLGLFVLIGLTVIGGIFVASKVFASETPTPFIVTTPPDIDPTMIGTDSGQSADEPTGRIIFTCQIQGDEVCIIYADGSGWQRLTNSPVANFNASLSPDGQSVIYVVGNGSISEIHELNINTGKSIQLTNLEKSVGSPEIAPDNQSVLFHYRSGGENLQLWMMNRDGSEPHEFYGVSGRDVHDGTWSPDGKLILFALGRAQNNKLYVMDLNGRDPHLLNDTIDTRGRSDWSLGNLIAFDMGEPFKHEVYLMNDNGSDLRQISPSGMNSQGASLSPDGEWIAFTAYTNVSGDLNSCEIFIMRVGGTDLRQLTNNSYCDYQPRWGN